jgi:hypothetical protein
MPLKNRIAFCWEMGSGSGHLTGLLAIADVLVEQGWDCAFFVPDTEAIARNRPNWANKPNVRAFHCPQWRIDDPESQSKTRTFTFADVLTSFGFSDSLTVSSIVARWNALLCDFQPDVVVTEFAPGALMAARGRFPCLAFGNGYYVLPKVAKLPSMTSWDPEVPPDSSSNETSIVTAINASRGQLGLEAFDSLSAAFRGDSTFPCTFATLDPYQAIRNEPTYVPFNIPISPGKPKRTSSGRGFVYYSFPHPVVERMLSVILSQSTIACTLYAPNYLHLLKPYHGYNGHEILESPMNLERLTEFSFCAHHGGMGISSTAAVAGVPQFVTPVNLEHALTATALSKQQAAIMALPEMILGWNDARHWLHAMEACFSLPMNLHAEFNIDRNHADSTLAEILQRVGDFQGSI